ncbi:hypothetical protein B0T10DRAFT_467428 [Thelonectria olida]|uniref:Uncharacterized protein n=1 Tax=Thelonectria olida TaxID=1576542 RepID=A0A9P9AJI9_9HYPO|nr:hypothetical protein B0T10DRAFT_467428 [Thelonectria olida]
MASLLQVFTEIKVLIFQELPSQDLLPIRLAYRLYRDLVTPLFIDSYFKTRYIMLERRSLQTLLTILKHAGFALHADTLEFNLHHLLPFEELVEIKPPCSLTSPQKDHLNGLDVDAYCAQWNNQEELMRTEFVLDCLTTAMSNLTQCKNLTFDHGNRPWGLDRIKEIIGILPQRSLTFESGASVRFVRHVLDIVLAAASTSKLQLEEINISPGCLMENANRVSPDMLPHLSAPITSLRHLHLVLDSDFPESGYTWDWEINLVRFTNSFPELTHFMLEFEDQDDFFRFSEASRSIYIPKLESLIVGLVGCTGDELADFLIRHKGTLREIRFDNINLTNSPMT